MNYKGYEFKWELSNNEKKFIDYLIKNNFEIIQYKQYMSKNKLVLLRDNIEFKYELYNGNWDLKSVIRIFERSWETHKEFMELVKKEGK
ncbi:MAG: hypothetical protein PHX70_14365 [Clostridium sp.]|nr:hypothetical protein [Clostridium sp.]